MLARLGQVQDMHPAIFPIQSIGPLGTVLARDPCPCQGTGTRVTGRFSKVSSFVNCIIMSDSGATAAIIIVVVLIVVLVLWGIYLSVKVVREKVRAQRKAHRYPTIHPSIHARGHLLQEAMVIERLGKWKSTLQAGLHFIVPFLGALAVANLVAHVSLTMACCLQTGHARTACVTTSVMPAAI